MINYAKDLQEAGILAIVCGVRQSNVLSVAQEIRSAGG
jgi:hypothetical protein